MKRLFGSSRDDAADDPAVDEKAREWQRVGFTQEDKPMLETQQPCVGDTDLMTLGPVLLGTDADAVRVRRTLKAMLDAEAKAADRAPAQGA